MQIRESITNWLSHAGAITTRMNHAIVEFSETMNGGKRNRWRKSRFFSKELDFAAWGAIAVSASPKSCLRVWQIVDHSVLSLINWWSNWQSSWQFVKIDFMKTASEAVRKRAKTTGDRNTKFRRYLILLFVEITKYSQFNFLTFTLFT